MSQNPLDLEVLPFSFLLGRRSLLSSLLLQLSISSIPDAIRCRQLIIIPYHMLGANDRFVLFGIIVQVRLIDLSTLV